MIIREAESRDAADLRELYFRYLTKNPPREEQDMDEWERRIASFRKDSRIHLLVAEEDNRVVATVHLTVVQGLTHNLRPFAVIESVVTHGAYEGRGFGSALLTRATEIAAAHNCYKIMLETGSNQERTLNFYRRNGFTVDAKHSCIKWL